MRKLLIGWGLLLCGLLSACSEDDYTAPAYREDLADLLTAADGRPACLVTDAGDSLPVVNGSRLAAAQPDTLYRVRALYVRVPSGAELYDMVQVLTPVPALYPPEAVKTDPLTVVAVWRGGRYLNFRLSVPTSGGGQVFGVVEEGLDTLPGGTRLLQLSLLHDQGADGEYYSREVYLSSPLTRYASLLRAGVDSVEVRIATYTGTYLRRYLY